MLRRHSDTHHLVDQASARMAFFDFIIIIVMVLAEKIGVFLSILLIFLLFYEKIGVC